MLTAEQKYAVLNTYLNYGTLPATRTVRQYIGVDLRMAVAIVQGVIAEAGGLYTVDVP